MSQQPVDQSFVRESWEDADHARDYIDAVTSVGLWESERRLMEMYVPRNGAALDTGCAQAALRLVSTRPAILASPASTCPTR